MDASTQGAVPLSTRPFLFPNREFSLIVTPDCRWGLYTTGVTVDQGRRFLVAVVVIVIAVIRAQASASGALPQSCTMLQPHWGNSWDHN